MEEEQTKMRDAAIAGFADYYWATETPIWLRDPFNGNTGEQCGDCGAWMEIVRPGKHQCVVCDWITSKEQSDE